MYVEKISKSVNVPRRDEELARDKFQLLWSPYVIGQTIIFLPCGFYLFFASPNLSIRRLDVYHTSTHGVALVQI